MDSLRFHSLTGLLEAFRAERTEASQRVSDIEERLQEYEQALDELERDHAAKLREAAKEVER
jgi:hypothetical protein